MVKFRVLFLGSGPAFINSIPFIKKYEEFSKITSGAILTPTFDEYIHTKNTVGNFSVYTFKYIEKNTLLRNLYSFWKYIREGKRIHSELRYSIIISPTPLMSGLAGVILAKLTKSKLVTEVNGNFDSAFSYSLGTVKTKNIDKLKERISRVLIHFVLKKSAMVKLVHTKQLNPLQLENKFPTNTFPNFVPIADFLSHPKTDDKFILLLGHPWYLKGVDILIQAFNMVSDDFPDYHLKIVGWCPEGKDFYEKLSTGNPKIELLDAVRYDKVIELMTSCSLYVLASRTDSSPRVLREAMASQKPIIAADIDGVPELIEDGYNGLLFQKEDINDLADKIRALLSNPEKAAGLSKNALQHVTQHLSESVYIYNYQKLLNSLQP